jgi:multicomponent Na+:H+ antiporter subunit B
MVVSLLVFLSLSPFMLFSIVIFNQFIMNSVILTTTTRILLPILLLFSVYTLIRGHQEPGGGFVGGLVAGMAFALYTISNGVSRARQIFPLSPTMFFITGLALALSSGLLSLFLGYPAFTGIWGEYEFPVIGPISTPFLFDVGVYLVVFGISTSIIFTLKLKE